MPMTGRFVDHRIRILAAVALLLAVMSSPILPTTESDTAPPPNFFTRKFAILEIGQSGEKIGHSGQFAMLARASFRAAGSLQSEMEDELDADIEDELTATSPPASVSFYVLPSPYPKPYSELVSFVVPLVVRPLRC
jgi:hypothetical protein